jgi:hypothetical protein
VYLLSSLLPFRVFYCGSPPLLSPAMTGKKKKPAIGRRARITRLLSTMAGENLSTIAL